MAHRVIVGVDGSGCSATALQWATAESRVRGSTLSVIGPCPDDEAATTLVEQAGSADLVVIGAVGSGSQDLLDSKPLGSVAQAVIRMSPSPVVIVPPRPLRSRHLRVVVGLDDPASASNALEWAVDEAELIGGELVIVHAWWHGHGDGGMASQLSRDVVRTQAASTLEAALESARARGASRARGLLLEDGAARAILGTAGPDDLLVIGSRGGVSARAMLFGSVAGSVISGSPCPVVSCRTRPPVEFVAPAGASRSETPALE